MFSSVSPGIPYRRQPPQNNLRICRPPSDQPVILRIKQNRLGLLNVDEYRDSHYLPARFPDGIATTGLPALVLIFHPNYLQNFKISCVRLARSKGGPAGKCISAKGPTNRMPFAPTRLVLKARPTRLHSRGARGLRQTAFKSSGWKRISSTLCHKSAWLPTTQPSNMVQCISKPAERLLAQRLSSWAQWQEKE
jgi:hypothetical protein